MIDRMKQEWQYYNHAIIPKCPPDKTPDLTPLSDGSIWSLDKRKAILVRYTSEFDCPTPTGWWYVIKDTPFDINELKAKRRYEINKGRKNFFVQRIKPCEYKDQLYKVQVAAFSAYPPKYRPSVDREKFFSDIDGWNRFIVYGAFLREDGKLCGYSLLNRDSESCIAFSVQKTVPEYEKDGVNAALVDGILEDNKEFLQAGGYICDGARSINHETRFQDYLEKYFCFRKAYCCLHIEYNPKLKKVIKVLYFFRKLLRKFDGIGIVHQINSVLRMEEIMRSNMVC